MDKLFNHDQVGISVNRVNIGYIISNIYEDEYWDRVNLIPNLHKKVEFRIFDQTIMLFKYNDEFDNKTDEAVKYWNYQVNVYKKDGWEKMARYFLKKDILTKLEKMVTI